MGVPTFYKWLSIRFPKVVHPAVEQREKLNDADCDGGGEFVPVDLQENNPNQMGNREFDNLYLDMNGIIHPCTHPEGGPQPEDEAEMFANICLYIDRIVSIVRPRKLLYMAIDGVAPRAKMNQQRMRRFKAAEDVETEERVYSEIKQEFEKEGREVPLMNTRWDSNVITPGTPFMHTLSDELKKYIALRVSTNKYWQSIQIVLSDANSPGEGEHKIMDFVRRQRTVEGYNANTVHCMHGMDADLIMLGLATHEAHFYIVREEVVDVSKTISCGLCGKTGHLISECDITKLGKSEDDPGVDGAIEETFQSSWKPLQFLRLPVLREYLRNELKFEQDALPFPYDFERCVDDFVMLCFFVGNDFLPHLPSLSIHKGSIDQMILLYTHVLPKFDNYLTNEGQMNVKAVKHFVSFLAQVEDQVFVNELRRQEAIRKRTERESQAMEVTSDAQTGADVNMSAAACLREALGGRHAQQPQEDKKPEFKEILDQKLKVYRESDQGDNVRLGEGNPQQYRWRYYQQKFHLNCTTELEAFASQVAQEYIRGIAWVLQYYYQGVASWGWYYPLHYAPFSKDLVQYGFNADMSFTTGEPFLPFEQLMAVLPPRSGHCLPVQYRQLMVEPSSAISDFYPFEFRKDPDGKRFSYQWVILLPFIDEVRLLRVLGPLNTALSGVDALRNSRGGDLVFSFTESIVGQSAVAAGFNLTDATAPVTIGFSANCGIAGVLKSTVRSAKFAEMISAAEFTNHCACAAFELSEKLPHRSVLLDEATAPEPDLNDIDLQQRQCDNLDDRSYNAGRARRLILGSLGGQNAVAQRQNDRPQHHHFNNNQQQQHLAYDNYNRQQHRGGGRPAQGQYNMQHQQNGGHYNQSSNRGGRGGHYQQPPYNTRGGVHNDNYSQQRYNTDNNYDRQSGSDRKGETLRFHFEQQYMQGSSNNNDRYYGGGMHGGGGGVHGGGGGMHGGGMHR
eukprot:Lankesteria_metandrocarpae@DN2724_c1_g1_i1.p1